MAGLLTIDQIIYSSIGVLTVFLAAWVLLLQKDFQSRFRNAKHILQDYRNKKKGELRCNLSKRNEDETLTEDLIAKMDILAMMGENIKTSFNDLDGRSRRVIVAFLSVVVYAIIFTVPDPGLKAIMLGDTRLMELHYVFLIFVFVFFHWFILLLDINRKMNDLENKEVDELMDEYSEEEE